ncbi:MAG TPA: DUF721 domain-containing protein [Bryobacteraceae bacterium]|jgi:hypothetical protein
MERASKLIQGLRLPGNPITPEELACAAWPQAVGKRIANHTHAAKLVRTRLVIEVEDAVWQRQLFQLSPQILRNLDRTVGPGIVDDIEFRIVPRKREPQRAVSALPLQSGDEAESIADPVLRSLYRLSRKRAGA